MEERKNYKIFNLNDGENSTVLEDVNILWGYLIIQNW